MLKLGWPDQRIDLDSMHLLSAGMQGIQEKVHGVGYRSKLPKNKSKNSIRPKKTAFCKSSIDAEIICSVDCRQTCAYYGTRSKLQIAAISTKHPSHVMRDLKAEGLAEYFTQVVYLKAKNSPVGPRSTDRSTLLRTISFKDTP